MSDSQNPLSALINHPLRLPAYMAPAATVLTALAETIGETMAEYLRTSVEPQAPTLRRAPSAEPEGEDQDYYDTLSINGAPTLRIALKHADVDSVATTLFQGEVNEPSLRVTVAEAVVKRLAEAVILNTGMVGGDDTVIGSPEGPLTDGPVMVVDYVMTVAEAHEVSFTLEFTRPLTDAINAPCPAPPAAVIDTLAFDGWAILGGPELTVSNMKQWAPGDKIELIGAQLDRILIQASTPNGQITLAGGELGTDGGKRCVRITAEDHTAKRPAGFSAPAAAPKSAQPQGAAQEPPQTQDHQMAEAS